MKQLTVGDRAWKLTDDGFCAHCDAYCASWLGDCDNPIHTMPETESSKLIQESL